MNNINNRHYKTAYRKAYSDFAQVLQHSITFNEIPCVESNLQDEDSEKAALETWEIIKKGFKSQKICENNNAFDCWIDNDTVCTGSCGGGTGEPHERNYAFIDISGRAWVQFTQYAKIYMVDTNGNKKPNQFGKDRWIFVLRKNSNNNCISKVEPYLKDDFTTENAWCHYPPCNYYSWIFKD